MNRVLKTCYLLASLVPGGMSRQREDSGHKMYGGPGGCSVRSVLLVSLMAANCAVGVDIRLAQTFVSRYLPGVSDSKFSEVLCKAMFARAF